MPFSFISKHYPLHLPKFSKVSGTYTIQRKGDQITSLCNNNCRVRIGSDLKSEVYSAS